MLSSFSFNIIVCELLADNDIAMDINKVKYWVDRADKQFPHHPVVFQLKEKLTVEKPNSNNEDLENLIICKQLLFNSILE